MIRRRNLLLASVAFCGLSSAFIIHNSDQDLFEVIVVGGGSAGLAAAVSAAERGLKVLVIEKRHRVGLNTHSDRGLFASSQSPTGEPSFNDSVENHYKNSFEAGGSLADPSVLMSFVSQAPETLKWLSSLGMSFDDSAINSNSLWRRCYQPLQTGYTETLYREAVRLGVKFIFNAALIDLKENKGRIDSVEVAQKNGRRKIYTATLGVVLCSGGFGANLKMVAELAPKYAGLESDNEPGASGEVLLIAKKKGAATSGLDRILCLPRPSGAFKSQGYLHLDISKFIFINSQGKRFVSEDALRPEITEAFFRERFKPIYELADDNAVKDYQMDIQRDLWRGIEHGTVFKGKTLGELAAKLSMPEENLITTVARYNEFVDKKEDNDYRKARKNLLHKIETGPFWAVRVSMKIHESLGGLVIDKNCKVLDINNRPISGLFAAGSIVGNIHGNNRLGGNGLSSAITLGRRAGKAIAGELL